MTDTPCEICEFDDVKKAEDEYIDRRRNVLKGQSGPQAQPCHPGPGRVGLALSGGGIRSATTNLGILQELAEMRLLPAVDYLCTVSGGGYIGGCLSSLLSLNENTYKTKEEDDYNLSSSGPPALFDTTLNFPLNDRPAPTAKPFAGAEQVAHLRTHGTFLIARRGLLTRDALRAVGNLLSGITFTVMFVALTLLAVAATVMAATNALGGNLDRTLRRLNDINMVDLFCSVWSKLWGEAAADGYQTLFQVALFGIVIATIAFVVLVAAVRLSGGCWTPVAGESREDKCERWSLAIVAVVLMVAVGGFACHLASSLQGRTSLLPIFLPAALVLATWITSVAITWLIPWCPRLWRREIRSVWGAFQAIAIYGVAVGIVFAILPMAAHVLADHGLFNLVGALISLFAAQGVMPNVNAEGGTGRLPEALRRPLLGLAVWLFLLFAVLAWSIVLVENTYLMNFKIAARVLLALAALGFFVNLNKISLHYFYRDRLAETYLRTETPGAAEGTRGTRGARGTSALVARRNSTEMKLEDLHGSGKEPLTTAPYHLVSAAINLAGSRDLTRKDRKSGFFLFSKYFCGSKQTGYRHTDAYRGGETKLARALTISGAAFSSAMGYHTFFAQAFATTLFNVRLGYWMENPGKNGHERQERWVFWPCWMLREMFSHTDARSRLVNLSDGGHTGDNVGIYPLLQRQCQVIIACDAEADPTLSFGSFTQALRYAYVDFGVNVDIDLDRIRPDPETGRSRSHCAIGRIRYKDPDGKPIPGKNWLIYIKSSMTGDETAPVQNYKHTNQAFPHESTADQFFDDDQFESYRALGGHMVKHTFERWLEDAVAGTGTLGWDYLFRYHTPSRAESVAHPWDEPSTLCGPRGKVKGVYIDAGNAATSG